MDEVLELDKAKDILEKLIEAQSKSHNLGLSLTLPPHEVEAIHNKYSDPNARLREVIISFLNCVPNPTWRSLIDALRTKLVNLPNLADKLEKSHSTSLETVAEATGSTGMLCIVYSIVISAQSNSDFCINDTGSLGVATGQDCATVQAHQKTPCLG